MPGVVLEELKSAQLRMEQEPVPGDDIRIESLFAGAQQLPGASLR